MSSEIPEMKSRDEEREQHRKLRNEHIAHQYFDLHKDYHLFSKVKDGTLSWEDAAKILEESARDPKTDVQRADLLQLAINYETYVAREHDHPLSIAILDIDHFKKINTELTHVGADEVLRDVVQTVVATMRESDDILPIADQPEMTRWGGEEFAILLPMVDVQHGREAAERFRQAIERELADRRPNDQSVTVSVGVSQYNPEIHPDASALLKSADEQLMAAKEAGRNRVFPEIAEAA